MKRVALVVLAAQSMACTASYATVNVPQTEARRVANVLASKPRAKLRDDHRHTFDVDDRTAIEVREDMFTSEVDHTTFLALRRACVQSKRCILDDDRATFRALVKTGMKPDEGVINGWVTAAFGVGAFGGLIAGNVACFSGACPDGVKAGLVAADLVVGGVVLVGVAAVALLASVRWN